MKRAVAVLISLCLGVAFAAHARPRTDDPETIWPDSCEADDEGQMTLELKPGGRLTGTQAHKPIIAPTMIGGRFQPNDVPCISEPAGSGYPDDGDDGDDGDDENAISVPPGALTVTPGRRRVPPRPLVHRERL